MIVLLTHLSDTTKNHLGKPHIEPIMADQDPRVGRETNTHIEFGPPKYQGTIREFARSELGANDLQYEKGETAEKMVVKAKLEVIEIKDKELQKKSETK